MELEEAIKVLKHWSTTISACDIDSNNRIAQALERILHYIKEESIPKAALKKRFNI